MNNSILSGITQKEFASISSKRELFDPTKGYHTRYFCSEIIKILSMGPICEATAVRHWFKNAVNGKMRENKLNPSYLVLQAAEMNRIPSISKIITPNIPIGKEFILSCINWIKTGEGAGKYILILNQK